MIARIRVDVRNRREALELELALADPELRAFVAIVGTLAPLTPRARQRVLAFVADSLEEQRRDRRRPETAGDGTRREETRRDDTPAPAERRQPKAKVENP